MGPAMTNLLTCQPIDASREDFQRPGVVSLVRLTLLASLLCLPLAAGAAPAKKRAPAHEALRTQCLLHAADPKNPWALAHGMTALGPHFAAADGRKASDAIVADFLVKGSDPKSGAYGFARYAPDRTPIEPHANLIVKTFVLSGLKDSTKFKASFGEVTLGDLVDSAKKSFRHVPQNEHYWQDAGWTLDLLAARLSPKTAKFKNGAGEEIDFDKVMDEALSYLEFSQKEIADGMDKQLPEVPKRKQGIYAHSCGGLHLFQAVAHWARHPEVKKKWKTRLDRQTNVLFYRLGSEQRQYEAAYNAAPQYRLQLLTQMVKFYGHFLETTGRLKKDAGFKPNAAQKRDIEKAKALLDFSVRELQAIKAFDNMDALKTSHPQVRLDLIGDSCHAVNGLEMWR